MGDIHLNSDHIFPTCHLKERSHGQRLTNFNFDVDGLNTHFLSWQNSAESPYFTNVSMHFHIFLINVQPLNFTAVIEDVVISTTHKLHSKKATS